jgi:formylglycine-generating enzyme required for sulfatase activity/predicted Ser/Thr protein kinase
MPQWLRILSQFRGGAATRDEVLSAVDALLLDGSDPSALKRSTREEHARNPLPAGSMEAIEDRIRRSREKTVLQAPLRTDDDQTQRMDSRQDATQLIQGDSSDFDERHATVAVNSVLQGRFKLVQLVGEGGMSDVYKAIDLRKVEAGARDPYLAVKVLTVRFDDYFSSLSVMHHEASKLQTLTHPNIVRVIDCDRDGQTVFMTMEYLDGIPLKFRMPKNRSDESLPHEEALRILSSIAAALDFAHRKHIVHGDLKPGNVIVTAAGEVKVIDFGIARFLQRPQDEGAPPDDWGGDFSALTPPYASPEMLEGDEPDPRDDVYALACISHELLAGEHPFGRAAATSARDSGMILSQSKRLRAHEFRAITNGLQFDRDKRTASAQKFRDELLGVRRLRFRQVAIWVGAALIALAAAIFAGRMLSPTSTATNAATRLTAGTVFRDCPTCPLMLVLTPATFEQGTAAGSPESQAFEQPAHPVTIDYPLAAGVYEITVGEFSEFAKESPREAKGCATYDGAWNVRGDVTWRNALQEQNASYPVTCVSWQDAADYASWLSKRAGVVYRLPSASEWEFMARAGSSSQPWAKPADACAHANAADASAALSYPGWTTFECTDNYAQTAPVGSFAPNAFGLSDTLGNVFEWVRDCWRDDYALAPHDGSAVLNGDCNQREARGGSWFTTPAFVRPAYRNRYDADYRASSLGFRLVREVKNEH